MVDAPQLPLDEAGPVDKRSLDARAAEAEVTLAWDLYCEMAKRCDLPVPLEKSPGRLKAIRKRLDDHGGIARWRYALEAIEKSRDLRGANARGWKAHLDWFVSPARYVQCLERVFDQDFGKPLPAAEVRKKGAPPPARDSLDVYRHATTDERDIQQRLFNTIASQITQRQADWYRHQDERRAAGHRERWRTMPPKGWMKP